MFFKTACPPKIKTDDRQNFRKTSKFKDGFTQYKQHNNLFAKERDFIKSKV